MEETLQQPVALKEWAVAVQSLAAGDLIVIMRKGGIIEETRDFRLIRPSFYLMPAFEHQRRELLKEPYRDGIDRTLEGWSKEAETMTLSAYAEAVEDIEVHDGETLNRIFGEHIWTETFAEERLKWKKKNPLHVLLLRVYKLDQPITVPMRPAYSGCKSWVTLEDGVPDTTGMTPVLSDEAFNEAVNRIRSLLQG
ncbi:Protein of unknown function DUF1802 [Paenibacillus curdlanolyticus YK9]|uniref:DUF1802 domain-containing protein n=1 Tax=Paenibacillus curdlanolyticus YK9 TaxID=717606 RepID=E0IBP7_9BACL|nr:DUF1802 family protein [Paenibacillus curdlanolyticus]EFM10127.1 Protein of unknown function DUF1802 [Paenibacillus curdlanolyticus YK9]